MIFINIVQEDNLINGDKLQVFEVGTNVALSCDSFGTVKWYHAISKESADVIVVSTSNTYSFSQIQYYHAGIYYCHGYSGDKTPLLDHAEVIVYGNCVHVWVH